MSHQSDRDALFQLGAQARCTEEELTDVYNLIASAGIKVDEAADNIRRFQHILMRATPSAREAVKGLQGIDIDYAAVEKRIFFGEQEMGRGQLLNPEDLYGGGRWRPIGRQRARTLRRRGELVERTPTGWRWWRQRKCPAYWTRMYGGSPTERVM